MSTTCVCFPLSFTLLSFLCCEHPGYVCHLCVFTVSHPPCPFCVLSPWVRLPFVCVYPLSSTLSFLCSISMGTSTTFVCLPTIHPVSSVFYLPGYVYHLCFFFVSLIHPAVVSVFWSPWVRLPLVCVYPSPTLMSVLCSNSLSGYVCHLNVCVCLSHPLCCHFCVLSPYPDTSATLFCLSHPLCCHFCVLNSLGTSTICVCFASLIHSAIIYVCCPTSTTCVCLPSLIHPVLSVLYLHGYVYHLCVFTPLIHSVSSVFWSP